MEGKQYTTKSDVYSFGIILWEICSREKPYEEYPVSKSQFLSDLEDTILKGLRPSFTNKVCTLLWSFSFSSSHPWGENSKVYDSQISENVSKTSTQNVCPAAYAKLVQQCWDVNPSNRPAFNIIVEQLKEIQSQLK
jgi:serine/threonine protein kinase